MLSALSTLALTVIGSRKHRMFLIQTRLNEHTKSFLNVAGKAVDFAIRVELKLIATYKPFQCQ